MCVGQHVGCSCDAMWTYSGVQQMARTCDAVGRTSVTFDGNGEELEGVPMTTRCDITRLGRRQLRWHYFRWNPPHATFPSAGVTRQASVRLLPNAQSCEVPRELGKRPLRLVDDLFISHEKLCDQPSDSTRHRQAPSLYKDRISALR